MDIIISSTIIVFLRYKITNGQKILDFNLFSSSEINLLRGKTLSIYIESSYILN